MIPALGATGPGFESQAGPLFLARHFLITALNEALLQLGKKGLEINSAFEKIIRKMPILILYLTCTMDIIY